MDFFFFFKDEISDIKNFDRPKNIKKIRWFTTQKLLKQNKIYITKQ